MRKRAGLFDLSHMAQFELRGDGRRRLGRDADRQRGRDHEAAAGALQHLHQRAGGAHDDVIFYRWPTSAGSGRQRRQRGQDVGASSTANAASGVELTNLHGERALIAIQGPRSVECCSRTSKPTSRRSSTTPASRRGRRRARAGVIARTGYTGEDGFELFLPLGRRDRRVGRCCSPRTASRGLRTVRAGRARRAAARSRDAALRPRDDRGDHAAASRAWPGRSSSTSRRSPARTRSKRSATRRLRAHRRAGHGRARPGARRLSGARERRARRRDSQRFDRPVRRQEHRDRAGRAAAAAAGNAAGGRGPRRAPPGDGRAAAVLQTSEGSR